MMNDKSKVLIFETNLDLANELKTQLVNESYNVDIHTAGDSHEGIDLYDIVIVDLDFVSYQDFYDTLPKNGNAPVLIYMGSIEELANITDTNWGYLVKDDLNQFVKIAPIEVNRANAHNQMLRERQALVDENRQLTKGLEEFAQTIGHEMKSPLSTIVSYVSILVSEYHSIPKDEAMEFLKLIETLSIKASNIVDTLLLLASIPHLKDLELIPIKLERIMNAVDIRLRDVIMDTNSKIIFLESAETGIGYEPWVEEVIVNLVSNAIKYGGSPPAVKVGSDIIDANYVRFWVKDNGQGIPKEEVSRIFTPFTRLKHTNIEGHGLGLSIVRQIVERLGGEVGVDSEVGHGSTFFFTLPRANHR